MTARDDDIRYMPYELRAAFDDRYVVKFDRKLAERERERYYVAECEARMLARRARAAKDTEAYDRHLADMKFYMARREEVDAKIAKEDRAR